MSLRDLPQVDALLREVQELRDAGPVVGRWIARREVEAARARVMTGGEAGDVGTACAEFALGMRGRSLRRVINATGVVLHTNLGRAPISPAAVEAIGSVAGASALEFDLRTGARAPRAPVPSILAAALCDAEAALVVNNNAAALLLLLAALADGREVLVGRGEMIEIGGGFRLPEVMAASGARLREVGTTNRTRPGDYAAGPDTAMILKVHPSNYEVVGFTEQASVTDLAEVAREAGVVLAYDIGSGLLAPDPALPNEPDATTALASGADLVCFSGDKLLGGPQAGILAGRADLISACARHPIARAVRADRFTLAAMEATLWAHARGEALPVARMLHASESALKERSERLAGALGGSARVEPGDSVPGGGSAPDASLPGPIVCVPAPDPGALAARLRDADPPVVARVGKGCVIVDLRTVAPEDDGSVVAAFGSSG